MANVKSTPLGKREGMPALGEHNIV